MLLVNSHVALVSRPVNHLCHYTYNKCTNFNLNYPWILYSFTSEIFSKSQFLLSRIYFSYKYPNIYELRYIYIGRKFRLKFSPQAYIERVYRTCITRPSFIPGRLLEFVIIFRISLSTFQIGLPRSRAFSQCMIIAKRAARSLAFLYDTGGLHLQN